MVIKKIARLHDCAAGSGHAPIGEIRRRVIRVSVFLAAFELLRSEVENGVRDYFLKGFDQSRLDRFEAYQRQVLSKHKSRFEASLRWLAQAGALRQADVICIRELRTYQREVACALPKFLVDSSFLLDVKRVAEMKDLLTRVTMFWSDLYGTANDNANETSNELRVVSVIDQLVETADGPSYFMR